LSFEEGFPTMPDGRPFWERLEHESPEAHLCMQAYLQMPLVNNGTRNLNELPEIMQKNNLLDTQELPLETFTAKFRMMFQTYCWHFRTRAYDLYKVAAHRKQVEYRALETQDGHFALARKLMTRLTTYFTDEEEFWDMMTPKVAIDMLKTLTLMQRVATGLPGMSPPTDKHAVDAQGATFEMILRSLAQRANPNFGVNGLEVIEGGGNSQLASRVLDDPHTTQLAQELILRMSIPPTSTRQ
jgi:hypothetical protein